jgi:hypothetical protein
MNDRQEAKLSMYREVAKVCRANEQVYAGVPAMNSAVQRLEEGVASILRAAGQQSGTTSQGATDMKNSALDALTTEVVQTANAVYVYALDTDNADLLVQTSVNKSTFYGGYVNNALVRARNIAASVWLYLPELDAYGVNEASLARLKEAIASLENVLDNPRTAIDERKVHTGNIRQLFVETDSTLYDRLDKLVTLFKTSAPDFYALYKNARNIIDTARRSRKTDENKSQESENEN